MLAVLSRWRGIVATLCVCACVGGGENNGRCRVVHFLRETPLPCPHNIPSWILGLSWLSFSPGSCPPFLVHSQINMQTHRCPSTTPMMPLLPLLLSHLLIVRATPPTTTFANLGLSKYTLHLPPSSRFLHNHPLYNLNTSVNTPNGSSIPAG